MVYGRNGYTVKAKSNDRKRRTKNEERSNESAKDDTLHELGYNKREIHRKEGNRAYIVIFLSRRNLHIS